MEVKTFFEAIDSNITRINYSTDDTELRKLLILLSLGLKETTCIKHPEEFLEVYKKKYFK